MWPRISRPAAGGSLVIDRVTASRLGIAPTTIDNTLYDAYGQRRSAPVHAAEPVSRDSGNRARVAADPEKLSDLYIQSKRILGTARARARPRRFLVGLFVGRIECDDHFGALHAVFAECSPRRRRCWPDGRATQGSVVAQRRQRPRPQPRPRWAQCHSAQRLHACDHTTEALSINHQGQFPSVTVSFNLAPNASLGDGDHDIDKVART
jgi:multidrug efflux pump